MTFRRTATQDVELGGQFIREGDWVAIIYSSANRDEKVFAHPDRFDILRSPNPHLGFGGGGPHNCMGNFVARSPAAEIFPRTPAPCPTLRVGEPST